MIASRGTGDGGSYLIGTPCPHLPRILEARWLQGSVCPDLEKLKAQQGGKSLNPRVCIEGFSPLGW